MAPQSMRLKNGPLAGLELKSNMTTKGPLLDHVATQSDEGFCVLQATGQ